MRGDEDKMFDELLRKSLEFYEVPPSPGVWSGIKHKLFLRQAWQSVLFKGNAGLIGSISTGIVITGLTAWYFTGNLNNSTAMDTGSTIQASMIAEKPVNQPTTIDQIRENSVTNTYVIPSEISPAESEPLAVSEKATSTPVQGNFSSTNTISKKSGNTANLMQNSEDLQKPVSSVNDLINGSSNNVFQAFSGLSSMTGRYADNLIASSNGYFLDPFRLSGMDKEEILGLLKNDLRSHYDYVRPVLTLSVGFSISNHWLTSSGENAMPASVLNPNAIFRLKREHFILETGIGISRESSYLTRDTRYHPLIGSYHNLDSISFVYDSINGTEIPTYHYHDVSVYDSVEHINKGRSDMSYVFASIPVFAGYSFNFKRHSILLKSGLIFSFLLNKSGYITPFSATDNIITSTEESGFRKSNSLKWSLEASYEYMLNDKASLFFGPVYTTFVGNPFRSTQILPKRNDYFGLKTGFIWNF
jgi:hypothetical protein